MEQSNLPAPRPDEMRLSPVSGGWESEYEPTPMPMIELLRRYVAAVVRYKWLILLGVAVGTGAAVAATRLMPLTYRAEATLWVQVADRNMEQHGPIQSSQLLKDLAWIELLRSFAVLDPVVDDLRMYLSHAPRDAGVLAAFALDSIYRTGTFRLRVNDGTIDLYDEQGTLVERATRGEPIGRGAGFLWNPPVAELEPGREVRFRVVHPRAAALELQEHITGWLPRESNFLRVGYTAHDPVRAAEVVNATVGRFVSLAADLKRARLVELRDTLESQLEYARINLERAELALERFKVTTITLPSDAATPVHPGTEATRASAISHYFDLKIEQDQLRRDLEALQRALADMEGTLPIETLSGIPALRQSPELVATVQQVAEKRAALRALRQQYTDEHRLVRAAVDELMVLERTTGPGLIHSLIAELGRQLAVADGLVVSASTELRGIPPRAIEEARLRRAVGSAERLYVDLLQRFENARLATETSTADVSLLTAARPPQLPARDTRLRLILMAFVGSLGLGIAGAIARERLDPRIRYPEEVTDGLQLRIIGAVPSMTKLGRTSRGQRGGWELVEAMRGIRLSLSNAYGTAGPLITTITSPAAGDGKSYLARHLGRTYAELGARTLLVDGDVRRGSLHRHFDIERRPGLTDFLTGSAELDACIRETGVEGLHVMPCGMRHTRAPELLASPRLGQMLARVRPAYDVILIDSPPLGAGVDPLILGSLAGNVVLVLRTGQTDRGLADAKLSLLEQLPIRILGAVLNGISRESSYRYYSYISGYEATEEDHDSTPVLQANIRP